jgi:hypothetical protein
MARCLDRRSFRSGIVQLGLICDRRVPGQQRYCFELWHGRIDYCIVAVSLLCGTDILSGCRFSRQYARWFASLQQMQDLQFKYRALNSGA